MPVSDASAPVEGSTLELSGGRDDVGRTGHPCDVGARADDDAVLVSGFDSMYFFYGNKYARFNPVTNTCDEGYPQSIAQRWVGVTFDRINAAVYWGDSKVYFFKGDQHIRYDLANYRSDPGYPKHVIGNYIDDWKFIEG